MSGGSPSLINLYLVNKLSLINYYLGSKISLIYKSEIRYEGIFYNIDKQMLTVALTKGKFLDSF